MTLNVAKDLGSLNARVGIIEGDVHDIKKSQERIEHSLIDSKGRLKGGIAVISFLIAIGAGITALFTR